MIRIVGIALLSNLMFGLVAQPVQSELYKLLDVPQPRRLFSIKHRVSFGEYGFSLASLFLISKNRKYFYLSFGFGMTFNPYIECYDHNGQLVSSFRVLDDKVVYEERKLGDQRITESNGVVGVGLFEDDTLCFLIRNTVKKYIRSEEEKSDSQVSYRFLVFTPQGTLDEKKSIKLNDMVQKLNNDINYKVIDDILDESNGKIMINFKKDIIVLFSKFDEKIMKVQISHDGNYSIITIPFPESAMPISSLYANKSVMRHIDSNGNIRLIIYNKEKREELIMKFFKIDKDYKEADEVKMKVDKKLIQYLSTWPIESFTVDARGHIFIVFNLKKALLKTEWQVIYYHDKREETPREHVVMAFPGHIVYEFDSSGQPIGPRAFLQTMVDLVSNIHHDDEDISYKLNRFTLDNHGNLYYLHYRPDGTEVWMVPRSTR